MLYYGPVRVPEDAAEGKATVRVELTAESAFKSILTEIEVKLVASNAK